LQVPSVVGAGSALECKYETRLKKLSMDKLSSLFVLRVSDEVKNFVIFSLGPGSIG
jgi:hypothetical protein